MLRRLLIVVIAILFVLIAAVFAYGNQDPIAIDIGLMRFEEVSLSVALAITFVTGAVFGGLFSAFALLKHFRARRVLRRDLRRAETQLENLRSLTLSDAD
jgi:uncharacterized membrane protein YciS (DUF1049 family)